MVTILSIKAGSSDDVQRIELSDGSLFSFRICYLPPACADAINDGRDMEGIEISAEAEAGFRFAANCMRTEKAALQLIARAEQTVFGLSRKLEKRGYARDCIGAVIDRLCEAGLLDDRRYARLWLESRIVRHASSPRRLLAALCARSINRHDAEQAVKEALDDETELLLVERYVQKLRRKAKNDDDDSVADHRALRYTLKSEGFSSLAIENYFAAQDYP